jgi:XTP/dITP diphosphohydrolase
LIFVTSNQHKYDEISSIMQNVGFKVQWRKMKYQEIQADTTEEVSLDSATKLAPLIGKEFFLEDTGLYIAALNGFPGPYSSYVQDTIGNAGILRLIDDLSRTAFFLTVITFYDGTGFHQFSGRLDGSIAGEITGKGGFGYDPIFIPEGESQTLGQLPLSTKNSISHRRRAVTAFMEFLTESGHIDSTDD